MDTKLKKYIVLGYGISGQAAARLCLSRKISFCIMEQDISRLPSGDKQRLQDAGVSIYDDKMDISAFNQYDYEAVITSPGVNPSHNIIKWADRNGINVISEMEFAFQFLKNKKIGVTGTNGKTTAVTLLNEIFNNAGKKSVEAGNIGTALSDIAIDDNQPEITVMELSSYQLERFCGCLLDVAVMTNVSSDHCERYDSFNDYVKAKLNIETNLKPGAFFICREADCLLYLEIQNKNSIPDNWCLIDRKSGSPNNFYADENGLWFKDNSDWKLLVDKNEFQIVGAHMFTNCAMAAQAAYFCAVDIITIKDTITNFKGLEHRLEKVESVNGVTFFNDSKATNIDAVIKAICNFDEKIVLILGGQDKGSDLTELKKVIGEKVRTVVLIGESTVLYEKIFSDCVKIIKADNMEEAVLKAYNHTAPGNIVLLSPACASFDMYDNFEHRGREFKKAVKKLQQLSFHN
ncbi:UDP-N-acetylmuramoyl-L-alanine--D-glutamate ligase [bacterium]|nr:UDP-N-acetylmuramoyl-L-alanine--D-glutamate ligase [bacterium]